MSNRRPTPPEQPASPPSEQSTRSGTAFVVGAGVVLLALLAIMLLVSPVLQERLGLNGDGEFPDPAEAVEVPLELGEEEVGVARWDSRGVCAEVADGAGTTFRVCATPDPLRPIWAIDAPDEADPPFVLVGTPNDVVNIEGRTTDGEVLGALTQARELPAAWAVLRLPEGAALDSLVAFGIDGDELGDAVCTGEDAPSDGPDRLSGGCVVPRQD